MKRVGKHLVTAWLVASFVLALAIALPGWLGFQRYVIVGESMTGTIPKGAIVYSRIVSVEDLRSGDIITFVPPGHTAPVTHRVISITRGTDGKRVFRTKGDFNKVTDPWETTFLQSSVSRYAYHIPYLGYALAAFAVRGVRVLLIAVPALLISLSILWSTWRAAGESVRVSEAGGSQSRCYRRRRRAQRMRGSIGPVEDEADA